MGRRTTDTTTQNPYGSSNHRPPVAPAVLIVKLLHHRRPKTRQTRISERACRRHRPTARRQKHPSLQLNRPRRVHHPAVPHASSARVPRRAINPTSRPQPLRLRWCSPTKSTRTCRRRGLAERRRVVEELAPGPATAASPSWPASHTHTVASASPRQRATSFGFAPPRRHPKPQTVRRRFINLAQRVVVVAVNHPEPAVLSRVHQSICVPIERPTDRASEQPQEQWNINEQWNTNLQVPICRRRVRYPCPAVRRGRGRLAGRSAVVAAGVAAAKAPTPAVVAPAHVIGPQPKPLTEQVQLAARADLVSRRKKWHDGNGGVRWGWSSQM